MFVNPKVNLNEIKNVNEEESKQKNSNSKNKAPVQNKISIPEKKDINKDIVIAKPPKPAIEDPKIAIRQQNAANFLKNQPPPKPKPLYIIPPSNNLGKNRPISAQQSPLNKINVVIANKGNLHEKKKPQTPGANKQAIIKRVLSSEPKKIEKKEEKKNLKSPAIKPNTPAVKENRNSPAPMNKINNIEKNEKNKAIIINKDKDLFANKEKELLANKEKEILANKEKQFNKEKELLANKEKELLANKEKELLKNHELLANKEKDFLPKNPNNNNCNYQENSVSLNDKKNKEVILKNSKELINNNSKIKNLANLSKSEEKKDIEKIFPRKVSVSF